MIPKHPLIDYLNIEIIQLLIIFVLIKANKLNVVGVSNSLHCFLLLMLVHGAVGPSIVGVLLKGLLHSEPFIDSVRGILEVLVDEI